MINIYRRKIKDTALQKIENAEVGSWMNIVNPTSEEIEKISQIFHVDKDALEDSIDENELPRVEKENGNILVYIRVPLSRGSEVNTSPLTIIISGSLVATISIRPNKVIQAFLDDKIEFYTTQKAKFLMNIFDLTVQRFNKHINAINKRVVSKKGKLKHLKTNDIISLVETEEDLNDFISSLAPNINVYQRILSGKYMSLYEADQEYVEDLLIDAKQVLDLCQTNIKRINNIREAYTAILSNNLNKIMRFLAAITVIFTLPTLIASIYGMNVNLPYAESPMAFLFVMAMIIATSFSVFFLFVWRKWI